MRGQLDELLQAAELLLLGGDPDDALEMLDEAVRLAPQDTLPFTRRAKLLITLGGTDHLRRAVTDLEQAIALGADSADCWFHLMRAHAKLGDLPAARVALAQAQALAPDDLRLAAWGVRLAAQADDPAEALRLVQAVRQTAPDDFHWMRQEAELLMMMSDYGRARQALTALIARHAPAEIAPGTWDAATWTSIYLKRAEACRCLGDLAAALDDLARAEALIPDEPGISFMRGLIRWQQGDADGAFDLLWGALATAAPDVRAGFWEELADYPHRGKLAATLDRYNRSAK